MTNNRQPKDYDGLYQDQYEHDACGIGMIVDLNRNRSHQIVDDALRVLENMRHRGAEIGKDGDGAGIMLQIPHEFILLQGIPVPERGRYGTGLVFMPREAEAQRKIQAIMTEEAEREGLHLMPLRKVPTNSECLGERARATEHDIMQMFVVEGEERVESIARALYIIRKKIERG